MKFFSLLYAASQLKAPQIENVNERKIVLDTDTEILSRKVTQNETVDNKFYVFKNTEAKNFLLNSEQSEFIKNTNVDKFRLLINYEVKLISNVWKASFEFSHSYNEKMIGSAYGDGEGSFTDSKGRIHVFETSDELNEINYKSDGGKVSVKFNPILKLKKDETRSLADGFIEIKMNKMMMIGEVKEYDLSSLDLEPYYINYYSYKEEDVIDKFVETERLKFMFMQRYPDIPLDIFDWEKTMRGFHYDLLNHWEENKYQIKAVPNKKYVTTGSYTFSVIFKKDNESLTDIENRKDFFPAFVEEEFHDVYLEPNDFKITIDLKTRRVKIKSSQKELDMNLGMNFPWNMNVNVSIKYGDELVAEVYDGELVSFNLNEECEKDLYAYFPDKAPKEKDVLDDWNKDEETKENESLVKIIEDVKLVENNESKKSPFRWLWFLTIPVISGIITLIIYFVPFRKKKARNEIK